MEEIKEMLKTVISLAVNNSKDDNKKGVDMARNAKEDKRKLIDEVGGILKNKVDEEVWRTIIGKLEKIAYEKSEADTADNACKKDVKNEDEEEKAEDKKEVKDIKEDVKEDIEEDEEDNEVNNSKVDFFKKVMDVYNAANKAVEPKTYESREDKLNAADEYFAS